MAADRFQQAEVKWFSAQHDAKDAKDAWQTAQEKSERLEGSILGPEAAEDSRLAKQKWDELLEHSRLMGVESARAEEASREAFLDWKSAVTKWKN